MATTPQLNVQLTPPPPQKGQDATRDNPSTSGKNKSWSFNGVTITQEDSRILLEKAQELRNGWAPQRNVMLMRVLEAYEFFKGNHFFGFWPGTFQFFDAAQGYSDYLTGQGKEDADMSLVDLATNWYQMVCYAWIAALSADVPRTEAIPQNAEEEEDRETAKAATTVQTIINNKNRDKTNHKLALFHLFNAGCYFRYTRYVVDSDLFKTHKQTVLKASVSQVVPDRYVCSNCGQATALATLTGKDLSRCPNCGAPLREANFFPSYVDSVPVAEQQADVPNGMVWQSIFGPMNIDVKPTARTMRDTPILSLDMEIGKGWLRSSYPEFYDEIQDGMGGSETQSDYSRQARRIEYAEKGQGYSTSLYNDPTFSRTWFQPQTFSELDDKNLADKFKQAFPKGVMIAHIGELCLQLRPASISAEWTWCGTVVEQYGLHPPAVGDPAIPLQKRYNNLSKQIDDFMERCASGITLANAYYIDKSLNRKKLLPGVLNPIALKNGQNVMDIQKLIHQFEFQLEPKILEWAALVPVVMQQLVGTPPQIFGGPGDPNVKTATGQGQQLNQARGKLRIFWDLTCEEKALSMEQAVECAAENMTDSWWNTVTDKTGEFRNEYVHPDQMRGSVHVQEATDQGFPLSPEDEQAFWEKILDSPNNVLAAMLLKEPKNMDACVRAFGIKGLITPGSLTEALALHYIDQLMAGKPSTETVMTAQGPKEIDVPSVLPLRGGIYDLQGLAQTIRSYAAEHFDKTDENQAGFRNLLAFFKLCIEWDIQDKQAMAAAQAGPQQMPPPAAQQLPAPAQAVQ